MRLPRFSASARLAVFSAFVSAVIVLAAVLPFLLESSARQRALEVQAVEGALAAIATTLRVGDIVSEANAIAPLRAIGLFADDGTLLESSGEATAGIEAAALLCPAHVSTAAVWTRAGDQALVGCVRPRHSPTFLLVGLADSPEATRRERLRQALTVAFAMASLAAALSIGAVRRLLSPIQGLTEAARALARGETEIALPPRPDPDFEPLSDALRALAQARNAQLDAIQQRLELTRQLAAIVAHEVRNPLQSLTMLADVVAHEPDPTAREALLRSIQAELGLIETVVRRLVGSGEDLQLVRRPTSLVELVQRAVALLGPEAREARVRLSVEPCEALRATVDGALFRRALENVVRNAIAILRGREDGRVTVLLERVGTERVRLIVDDNGPGVPPEERERIFAAGVSGRPGGSGLGLPLARMVASGHGGTLHVEASPQGGARFVFEFPLRVETS